MPWHTVQQGECLVSIAKCRGFPWRAIYDHSLNESFRARRPNPNVIYPGDRLFIPGPEPREESGETESRHRFRRRGEHVQTGVLIHDMKDGPLASRRYALVVGGERWEGRTDSEGRLEHTIPVDAERGTLWVWLSDEAGSEPMRWPIAFGTLNPEGYVSGVKQRLRNLGYPAGDDGEELDPLTRESIVHFQKDQGLPLTGEADDATRQRLVEMHAGI